MSALSGRKILIVDDEDALREILSVELSLSGADVSQAESGAKGLESIRNGAFDTIISDIRMPDVDGITLLKSVKSEFPKTQVYLVTGFADISREEAIELGAEEVLYKPYDVEELVHILTTNKPNLS